MVIDLKVTSACDSFCTNCHIWQQKHVHMPLIHIYRLFSQYPDAEFILSGGEFLEHPQAFEILRIANELNINYIMLTNVVNYERSEKAILAGCKRLTVSCDGTNHDVTRGIDGNLANVIKLIENYGNVAQIRIAYTICGDVVPKEDIDLLKSLVSKGAMQDIYFCLYAEVGSFNVENKIADSKNKVNLEDILPLCSKTSAAYLNSYNVDRWMPCGTPVFYISVYQDGNVRYCQSYNFDIILGNVFDDDLSKILDRTRWIRNDASRCQFKNECWVACHRRHDSKN